MKNGVKILLLLGSVLLALPAQAADQKTFATPDDAVAAMVDATRNDQTSTLVEILGPRGEKLVYSGDPVADQNSRERFVAAYDAAHKLESEGDNREVLVVGENDWPMPIPLVHKGDGWIFDTDAGDEEILNRRIGRDELSVIEVCRAYVAAQRDFAAQNPQHEYASHFLSHQDAHDGLYWPTAEGEDASPLGPLMAAATAEGYEGASGFGKALPYHGYYYKILTGQGPHAPGGKEDYMDHGRLTRGFALVAFPARYGDSGVMTFIVNGNGIVHQKNLGPRTAKIAAGMKEYDPDRSWEILP